MKFFRDLKETLNQLSRFIENDDVEFIICDDGSSDGTSNYIESNYNSIQLIKMISVLSYAFQTRTRQT